MKKIKELNELKNAYRKKEWGKMNVSPEYLALKIEKSERRIVEIINTIAWVIVLFLVWILLAIIGVENYTFMVFLLPMIIFIIIENTILKKYH